MQEAEAGIPPEELVEMMLRELLVEQGLDPWAIASGELDEALREAAREIAAEARAAAKKLADDLSHRA